MRVQIVDPAAYTPPYDHALAGALARAGAEVELVTCEFPYGSVPREPGYEVTELFYRRSCVCASNAKARRALRAAEHVPGMLRHRRHARSADVVHYQWLPGPPRSTRDLLADVHPRVFTMHWRFPEPGSRIAGTLAKLLARMDGVVAHSRHGVRAPRLAVRGRSRPDRGDPARRLRLPDPPGARGAPSRATSRAPRAR